MTRDERETPSFCLQPFSTQVLVTLETWYLLLWILSTCCHGDSTHGRVWSRATRRRDSRRPGGRARDPTRSQPATHKVTSGLSLPV